jgi:hypothetical protein
MRPPRPVIMKAILYFELDMDSLRAYHHAELRWARLTVEDYGLLLGNTAPVRNAFRELREQVVARRTPVSPQYRNDEVEYRRVLDIYEFYRVAL